jgi:hypothetical protein
MPVTPASLAAQINMGLGSRQITGTKALGLSQAIANAFVAFLPSLTVVTAHVGVLGTGVGTGKAFLEFSSGEGLIVTNMVAHDIKGSKSTQLAGGIAFGISTEINTLALAQVTVVGTSTGTGTGGIPSAAGMFSSFEQLLNANFLAQGLTGSKSFDLASALAKGIATWLSTVTITTTDVGVPVFPYSASAGTGTGILF